MIFAKLRSIVEEGPCQVILEIRRRNGVVGLNRESVNTEGSWPFRDNPVSKPNCRLNSKYSISKRVWTIELTRRRESNKVRCFDVAVDFRESH